jgi:hypothetical protein
VRLRDRRTVILSSSVGDCGGPPPVVSREESAELNDHEYEGALAEFHTLRIEIDSRSKFQQQILGIQLSLTSAIVAFGLSRPEFTGIMFIVPLSSYLLCARYVGQRTAIRWAARYIDEHLNPRVPGGLGWTRWSLSNRRPDRVVDWFVPLTICFPGASLLALGWTWGLLMSTGGPLARAGVSALWIVGAFATVVSTYLLARVIFPRRTNAATSDPTRTS